MNRYLFSIYLLSLTLLGCASDWKGIFIDQDGNPVAQGGVVLLSIDDQGNTLETLDSQVTNEKGELLIYDSFLT